MSYITALRQYAALYDPSLADAIGLSANRSLSALSTMRTDGEADLVVYPKNENAVSLCLRFCVERAVPHYIIGRGSNTLFATSRYGGILLSVEKMADIALNDTTVTVGAGVPLPKLCRFAADAGLSGLEAFYGIPGSVGGAVAMNAGAFGKTVGDLPLSVTYATKDGVYTEDGARLLTGYRDTFFLHNPDAAVTRVSVRLTPGKAEEIRREMAEYVARRRATQPLDLPSLGSIYKRPSVGYAGKYIEDAGLKGLSVGGAAVSQKHAGFIVNTGGATAEDVLQLMQQIEKCVYEKFGVTLVPEIRIVR